MFATIKLGKETIIWEIESQKIVIILRIRFVMQVVSVNILNPYCALTGTKIMMIYFINFGLFIK